jgi:hypothetical protein
MGGHTIVVEADLMRIATRGPLSALQAEQAFARIASVLREHGAAYLLIDARGGLTLDGATRRQVTHLSSTFAPTAIAVYGATLPQQAMLILLSSAVQVLRGKRVPLRFSRSEAEAEAWLRSQRPAGSC